MKVMSGSFDFERIGKRMPYTVPDGAFDELERNVWRKVADDGSAGRRRSAGGLRVAVRTAAAVAAAVALFFAVDLYFDGRTYDMGDVEQAFDNLSGEDQTYILQVYEDDLFMNELY